MWSVGRVGKAHPVAVNALLARAITPSLAIVVATVSAFAYSQNPHAGAISWSHGLVVVPLASAEIRFLW